VLGSTGLSLFALWRAHNLLAEADQRAGAGNAQQNAEVRELRQSVVTLAAQLHDLERHPPAVAAPGLPRPGLNLSKRTQALRMHRQGEPPDQIATSLELPLQEVDLLLKVHRIVIANVN
jgi:hypothetical protein